MENKLKEIADIITSTDGNDDQEKEPRDGVKSAAAMRRAYIEGLLSIPLKSKFLEAFQDLYFDLVEENPFEAEDVVDHLGIEMLKHLACYSSRNV